MNQATMIDSAAAAPWLDGVEGVRDAPIVPHQELAISGKKVLVFDGVFTDSFVETFGVFLLGQNYSYRSSFDNELAADIDRELFRSLPAIPEVTAAILAHYYPQMVAAPVEQLLTDVYTTAIRFGDSFRTHQDAPCADCVTFLYYGNLIWKPGWGAETIFYDDDLAAAGCVSPRPGRLVFFNAPLFHRAGVPGRDCPTFRYALTLFYRCGRILAK